jgi:hypothetical protein
LANHKFKDVTRRLGVSLRAAGFRRRASAFHREDESGNQQIIELQRSARSEEDQVVFTVNVGTFLKRLASFFPARHDPPSTTDCHWSDRLGFLLPGREDRWWAVDADTDVAELADALTEAIVDYAIPVLVRYSSEEQLRDLWLSGQASNLTDVQRLMHLSVLLDAIGPREELQKVVGELSAVSAGRPTAGVVQRHLERLQESRPN